MFPSRNAFAAYMYSWATTGEHLPDRTAHMQEWEPDSADVERVSRIMELAPF